MNNEVFGRTTAAPKVTWVVICTPDTGKPYPEYVEGTQLETDAENGTITILDGPHVVKSYFRGAWSNFAEWVSYAYGGTVVRRPDDALPAPRSAPSWSPVDLFGSPNALRPSRLPTPREADS